MRLFFVLIGLNWLRYDGVVMSMWLILLIGCVMNLLLLSWLRCIEMLMFFVIGLMMLLFSIRLM